MTLKTAEKYVSSTIFEEGYMMTKVIGILLIVLGVPGIIMGLMMFGDIGIACLVGAISALLSGIGFLSLS